MEKKAVRVAYGEALVKLGEANDKVVVLDADLASATMTNGFKKAFPDRFYDCGIAEANMVDMAAGISTMGLIPFCSTFAVFAGRNYDQIRNGVCYPKFNVKFGFSHAGITLGEDGGSHMAIEDIALMRTIPGMVVISPADDIEAKAAVKAAYEHDGPVYLRFGRLAVPVFHGEDYQFEIGKAEVIADGTDIAIIAAGIMVPEAIEAGKALAEKGIRARIINVPTIKPIDEEVILSAARECGKILTVEEHSVIGGLGDAVASVIAEKAPVPLRKIGVQDVFGHSGKAEALLRQFGLCADNIVKEAAHFMGTAFG